MFFKILTWNKITCMESFQKKTYLFSRNCDIKTTRLYFWFTSKNSNTFNIEHIVFLPLVLPFSTKNCSHINHRSLSTDLADKGF